MNPKTEKDPIKRFWHYVRKGNPGECWIWTGMTIPVGYGYCSVTNGKRMRAHRFSYILANGPIEPYDLCVCHRCDTKLCVNPDHLFLGTQAENIHDMYKKGRQSPPPVPVKWPATRVSLTDEEIRDIRTRVANGESHGSLRREYGTSRNYISMIVNNKTRVTS